MSVVLLCARKDQLDGWERELSAAMPGETIEIWPDVRDPADADIALVARVPAGAWDTLPNVRFVASLWAGVDRLLTDPTFPRAVRLTRLIDPALTASMVEAVVLHVLSAHRLAPRYLRQQMRVEWRQHHQPAAHDRTIAILGFGELGRSCAEALAPFGFRIAGWTRTPRTNPGFELHHGDAGLRRVLERADIVVCLLPATKATCYLLDAERLGWLPAGASIVNVGRGSVIDDGALLRALDAGRLESAILDVFHTEPLPAEHPFWRHERVWVYPHVAAETDARSASRVVAETIRRYRAGEPLPEEVDLEQGY
jgi:glyoxylate/hydroxypyruvate reductase A